MKYLYYTLALAISALSVSMYAKELQDTPDYEPLIMTDYTAEEYIPEGYALGEDEEESYETYEMPEYLQDIAYLRPGR